MSETNFEPFNAGVYRTALANHFVDAGVADGIGEGVILDSKLRFVLDQDVRFALKRTLYPGELDEKLKELIEKADDTIPFHCERIKIEESRKKNLLVTAFPNEATADLIRREFELIDLAVDIAGVGLRAHNPTRLVLGSFAVGETAATFAQSLSDNFCGARSLAPVVTFGPLFKNLEV